MNKTTHDFHWDPGPAGCKTYLIAMLAGAVFLGFALPMVSAYVDGRLYHDFDTTSGIGDDMFGALVPVFWYVYSALYGACLGALSILSVRDRPGWSGLAWIVTSMVFFVIVPASRPQGEPKPSGEPNLMPFQVFCLAPKWLCAGVLLVGVILLMSGLCRAINRWQLKR